MQTKDRPVAFDFDEVIERRGTHCSKVDMLAARFGITDPDVIADDGGGHGFPLAARRQRGGRAGWPSDGVHGYFGDAARDERRR